MGHRNDHEREVGRQYGEVAVGQIDDPNHAEEQRQSAGEERIEATEHDPLDDRVDPVHGAPAGPARPDRPK